MAENNHASQAIMKSWAKQVSSRLIGMPAPMLNEQPTSPYTLRSATHADIDEIVSLSNHFYRDFNLYTHLTTDKMRYYLDSDVFHYYVATDEQGTRLAGILLSERSALMVGEFHNVPPALRASGMIPSDDIMRTLEATALWYTDLSAGKDLWEYIRWAFRERCNTVVIAVDLDGPLQPIFDSVPEPLQFKLMTPISGPTLLDGDQWISSGLRG